MEGEGEGEGEGEEKREGGECGLIPDNLTNKRMGTRTSIQLTLHWLFRKRTTKVSRCSYWVSPGIIHPYCKSKIYTEIVVLGIT
jgi:hypothetical protein